ncbi:hypothetical protein Tco_1476553 [Tanacetum coccineum]
MEESIYPKIAGLGLKEFCFISEPKALALSNESDLWTSKYNIWENMGYDWKLYQNDVELLRPVWIQCARNGFGSCGGDSDVEDGSRYFYLARRNDNVENLNDCNMEEANVIFSGNRSTMNLEDDAPDRMQAGKFSIITCKRFCKPDPQAVPWSAEISEVTIIGTKEDWRVRPISLIGSLYKIMQKFWPNRLVGCFGDIVNERFAIAFIADRVRFMMALFILNEVLGGGQGERTVFNFK